MFKNTLIALLVAMFLYGYLATLKRIDAKRAQLLTIHMPGEAK